MARQLRSVESLTEHRVQQLLPGLAIDAQEPATEVDAIDAHASDKHASDKHASDNPVTTDPGV